MLVQFRSPATETITMFGDVAVQLLKLMGATGASPAALSAEDVPAALQRLESAVEEHEDPDQRRHRRAPGRQRGLGERRGHGPAPLAADPAGNAGRPAAEPDEARRGGQSHGDLGRPAASPYNAAHAFRGRPPRRILMGRIFEVRKHAMFARWNRMAKQFARIGKDITIAVKSGGTDPNSNSAPAPRDAERARRQHAEGQGRGRDPAAPRARKRRTTTRCMYEGYAPHGVAVLVEAATDNPTRTVASVRNVFSKHGGNLATSNSVSFMFKKMGVFRLNPEGIDQDDLELYLIDHGLEEMGESTGEKGEPQIVIRCLFADFGHLQKALEDRKHHAAVSRARVHLPHADRAARAAGDRSDGADRQARAGRRRAEGVSHAGVRAQHTRAAVAQLVEAHLVGVARLVLAVLPARGDVADQLHALDVARCHARQARIAIVRTVAARLAVERAARRQLRSSF